MEDVRALTQRDSAARKADVEDSEFGHGTPPELARSRKHSAPSPLLSVRCQT
jgi:hypothetical protein